jgi:hypothetical protein
MIKVGYGSGLQVPPFTPDIWNDLDLRMFSPRH